MNLKVLWFSNTPSLAEEKVNLKPVGGGWIKALNEALQYNQDIELAVAFYSNKESEEFKYKNTHYLPIINTNTLPSLRYINKLIGRFHYYQREVEKYLKIIRDFEPDLIHIHGTESLFGLVIKKIDIPVLISMQGNYTVYSHKFYSGISRRESERVNFKDKLKLNTFYQTYRYFKFMSKYERQILLDVEYVMGRTRWDKRIARILAPNAKYFHGDEILRDIFYQKEWKKEKGGKFVICSTMSRGLYKGLETICSTIDLLLHLDFEFEWKLIGIEKQSSIINVLRRKYKDKIFERIKFLGRLDVQYLIDELLTSDVYVHTSHIENSSNSVCESMILGMPLIATFAGGTGSLFTDDIHGILIQDGDPYALAGAILEVFDDFRKSMHMGQMARKLAFQRHSKQKIADDLVNVYQKIIKAYENSKNGI